MKKGIFFAVACFLVFFAIVFVFITKNKNSNQKQEENKIENISADSHSKIVGQIETINEDHLVVVAIKNRGADDGGEVYLSGKDIEQVKLGVNGSTPVFILNDETGEETISQMAELEWRDYAVIKYDEESKEIKKILILKSSEAVSKAINS